MGDQMKTFGKSFNKKEGMKTFWKKFMEKGKWRGYATLISVVISFLAVMFGSFIPLVATSLIIIVFLISKKLNFSNKLVGYLILSIIGVSLFSFVILHSSQNKVTGNSILEEFLKNSTFKEGLNQADAPQQKAQEYLISPRGEKVQVIRSSRK